MSENLNSDLQLAQIKAHIAISDTFVSKVPWPPERGGRQMADLCRLRLSKARVYTVNLACQCASYLKCNKTIFNLRAFGQP